MEIELEGLEKVLRDVSLERIKQIRKGYDAEHDDQHHTHDFVNITGHRIFTRSTEAGVYQRQWLIEGIAVLVAAVESMDRQGILESKHYFDTHLVHQIPEQSNMEGLGDGQDEVEDKE